MTTPVVELRDLSKRFGKIEAVRDVSLNVEEGDVFGILGPNGAGKTTIISMILGLVSPTSGRVGVLGEDVMPHKNAVLARVGSLVGDGPAYFPYLTARQNVEHVARISHAPDSRVGEVLTLMRIADAADRKPHLFSTGMKQRLGLAMALVRSPKLLILDEPTNGMDPVGMKEIRELIRELAREGITIILCSHLLNEVEQVCNRVAIFSNGRKVAEEKVGDQKLEDLYVASVGTHQG